MISSRVAYPAGCSPQLRHVQLKSSHRTAATREVGVNVHLARKPCGCVIRIQFDPETMDLGPFLWFGAAPTSPLPTLGERMGRHTKADSNGVKAERPSIRLLRKSQFEVLPDMDAVAQALFGAESHASAPLRTIPGRRC